jgi:uncharacterized membrane protein
MLEGMRVDEERRFRWMAAAILSGTGALLVLYGIEAGWQELGTLWTAAGLVFLSKLWIFWGAVEGQPFSPWMLGLVAWVLDLLVSLLLLTGLARLERLPIAGAWLRHAHAKAATTLILYPGLKRMAVGGVMLFVFLPLPASGAVTGTLIARLVGLARTTTLITVAAGAAMTVVVYALLAEYLGSRWEHMAQSPWTWSLSLAALLGFCWLAWRRVRRVLQQA